MEFEVSINTWWTKNTPPTFDKYPEIPRDHAELIVRAIRSPFLQIHAQSPTTNHYPGATPRYAYGYLSIDPKRYIAVIDVNGGRWHGYAELLYHPHEIPIAYLNNPIDGMWALQLLHDIALLNIGFNPCVENRLNISIFYLFSATPAYCDVYDP